MRAIFDLDKLVEEFLAYLRLERGLSENTAEAYHFDLQKLFGYLLGTGTQVSNTTFNDLEGFAASLMDLGIAEASRKRVIAGVKTFFHFLKLSGYIAEDPSELLETPVIGLRLPEVLTVEEIDRMAEAIDLESAEGVRNRAILETLYGCGLRVSELVNLEFRQLMMKDEYLIAHGKGNKDRIVPMSEVSIRWITRYVEESRSLIEPKSGEENIVFLGRRGSRLSRQMIFTMMRRIAEVADIRRTISPHTLRHSFATHLLEGGANLLAIQQMLGHESISTTEVYLNIDTSHLRQEITLHHPRNLI